MQSVVIKPAVCLYASHTGHLTSEPDAVQFEEERERERSPWSASGAGDQQPAQPPAKRHSTDSPAAGAHVWQMLRPACGCCFAVTRSYTQSICSVSGQRASNQSLCMAWQG